MRAAVLLPLTLGLVFAAGSARADIYKFQKPDGTVVYTDNLAQLPPDKREYYNKLREEREEKRREAERTLGKEEVQRREAEAQKAALEQARMEEAERQKRLSAIDETLKVIQQKTKDREANRETWRKRMQDAVARQVELLKQFNALQERVSQLVLKSYTLLPGEAEELEKSRKQLGELEKAIDQQIEEVEVRIPDEARKAGIPPGYLR